MAKSKICENVVLRDQVIEVWSDGEPHQNPEHCEVVRN